MTLTRILLSIQNGLCVCVQESGVSLSVTLPWPQAHLLSAAVSFLFYSASALLSKPPNAASHVDMATANIGFVRFQMNPAWWGRSGKPKNVGASPVW